MSPKLMKESLAELMGTFILVFIGAFAVVIATTPSTNVNVLVPAFAHGLVLVGIIYSYGHISGAHVNPAVTVALLVAGKVDIPKAVVYIIAQFIGSILAALLIVVILGGNENVGEAVGNLTNSDVWRATLFEAILTFLLVSTVFQAAVYGKAGNLAGLVIGFTLIGLILAGGVYTGASLNPARTLGPSLVAGNLDYVVPYFLGIFGGGAVAGLFNSTIMKP